MRTLVLLLLAFCTISVRADIYKFVDDEGNVTYTNIPRPGAKKVLIEAPLSLPPTDKARKKKSRHKSRTSPRDFPKVDASTQKRRDDMRRQILMQELRGEQNSLEAAGRALANARLKPGADLTKQEGAVRLHEKNIQLLKQELSYIR